MTISTKHVLIAGGAVLAFLWWRQARAVPTTNSASGPRLPGMPAMPSMPAMPAMPQMPSMPAMPAMPQMPAMVGW